MKKYEVIVDYVSTCAIVVEARDEESAERKAWNYVHSKAGYGRYIGHMVKNVKFGRNVTPGEDGFEIADTFEWDGQYTGENIIDTTEKR